MQELPRQGQLQQLQARKVTGEHLEVLGKYAATSWGTGRHSTLTEAVVAAVKTASLSPEQVRRVVEFANTEAFSAEFRKESAAHHVVNFKGGPADMADVLRDLNDGGGGTIFDRGLGDYNQPPETTKHASADADAVLAEHFRSGQEAPVPSLDPLAAAFDLQDKLASLRDRLALELSGLEVCFYDLTDRLYGEVKQAALEGTSLGDIAQAWQTTAPDVEYIKAAFAAIGPRLLEGGVFSSVAKLHASVEKTAAVRMVNQAHPLITEFSDYCEALAKLAESRQLHDDIVTQLAPLQLFLKQAAGGAVPAMWRHYSKGVEGVGKHVGDAAEWLVNNPKAPGSVASGTNKAVQFLGKKVLPALAAHQVYRNIIEPSSLYQSAANAILPNTPGTQQYYGY